MAKIELPHRSNTPFLRFSVRRDLWVVGGDVRGKRDLKLEGETVALDIENVRRGWLSAFDGKGIRTFVPVDGLDGPMPPAPEADMRPALSLLAFAPKAFRTSAVYEMLGDTFAHTDFVQRLYNDCTAHFGKDEVPRIVFGVSQPIKRGEHDTRTITYTVKDWIGRDKTFSVGAEPSAAKSAKQAVATLSAAKGQA